MRLLCNVRRACYKLQQRTPLFPESVLKGFMLAVTSVGLSAQSESSVKRAGTNNMLVVPVIYGDHHCLPCVVRV